MNQAKVKVFQAKSKKVLGVAITYCILIIVAFVFLFPCLWLILASFSKSGSIYSFDGFFPSEYGFDAFAPYLRIQSCIIILNGFLIHFS